MNRNEGLVFEEEKVSERRPTEVNVRKSDFEEDDELFSATTPAVQIKASMLES